MKQEFPRDSAECSQMTDAGYGVVSSLSMEVSEER
jgi:hypothetical protein